VDRYQMVVPDKAARAKTLVSAHARCRDCQIQKGVTPLFLPYFPNNAFSLPVISLALPS